MKNLKVDIQYDDLPNEVVDKVNEVLNPQGFNIEIEEDEEE